MKKFYQILSYILVAALASTVTLFVSTGTPQVAPVQTGRSKLDQLADLIEERFIGEADRTAYEDAAAHAMVAALGDEWSYYIPASKMQDYVDTHRNEHVGIGVSIEPTPDGTGILVLKVEPGTPAQEGGILPGDVIVAVDGTTVAQAGWEAASDTRSGNR